jgi:Mg-chelatase subunit ChlD
MRILRGLLVAVFCCVVVLTQVCGGFGGYAANNGTFDLDVVFAIDNSGSMLNSDPTELALSAANLFIDMCEGSDSRVGYVMFTHEIEAEQPLTDIQTFSGELKQAISVTDYNPTGDTDTALGLETAYELLRRDALDAGSDRKPLIILLSDGNTDIPRPAADGRTTQESLEALDAVVGALAADGVPVYTIGFNYNGNLDVDAMNAIAESTNARPQEANAAGELPGVLRGIYEHLTGSKSNNITVEATGEPQTVQVPIENDSVYKAAVTIMAENAIQNVSMTSPDGTRYEENGLSSAVTMNRDLNEKYILITLYDPLVGGWDLTFTGTEGDSVSIDLLSVYDLTFVFDEPVVSGQDAEIAWHLEDENGLRVTDQALIDGLEVVLHANGGAVEIPLAPGQTRQTLNFAPGEYEAYLTMMSDGFDEEKISNTRNFTVEAPVTPPIELLVPAEDTIDMALTTLFAPEGEMYLDDLVYFDDVNRPLRVEYANPEDWEDFADLEYDETDERVDVSALKSGNTEAEIVITGADGSSVTVYLNLKISSGWLYVIIAGGVVLALLILVVVLLALRKPHLDTPLRSVAIRIELPDSEIMNVPPETRLTLPHTKGKKTLAEVIAYNRADAEAYTNALRSISWLSAQTVFQAKNKTELSVKIPVNAQYTVLCNDRKLSGVYVGTLSGRSALKVTVTREDDVYEMHLGEGSAGYSEGPQDFDFGASGAGDPADGFDFM